MNSSKKSISTNWIADCAKIADWARSIGLEIRKTDPDFPDLPSFFPDIWIISGTVYYNDRSHPGDLLHEMGHVAVNPSWLRHHINGDADLTENPEAWKLIDELENQVVDSGVEVPGWKALLNSGEEAAIAWSFAAAASAGVNTFLPFENNFITASGKPVGKHVHESLADKLLPWHPGIHNLFHAGMLEKITHFPNLSKWVQD